jgi:hypothetical protein
VEIPTRLEEAAEVVDEAEAAAAEGATEIEAEGAAGAE